MHLQDINNLLNLQDINVVKVYNVVGDLVYITVQHQTSLQPCSCYGSSHVIRRGVSGYRKVRHLTMFGLKTILLLPRVRLSCKDCFSSYTMQYSFVCGKSRYTNQYKEQVADAAVGATVTNSARVIKTPYSTAERMFKEYLDDITPKIYNIKPVAVVIDLAPYYHTFVAETFPSALRVADRFHVNRYALDAMQNVRKRISSNLSPTNRTLLKQNKFLLSKRYDQLTTEEMQKLDMLLNMSSDLEKTRSSNRVV